ncbi:MAG: type II secretion system protein [Rhodocyclaceae bacterium]|nr:type II secretion system protein [Rhodocyclaceae bacterium]
MIGGAMSKRSVRGFTLVELVMVIVLIGILSAVAIPNFTGVSNDARLAKQQATLGMLKSAWGTAYAIKKSAPLCSEVVAQAQGDPVCTGTTSITCTGRDGVVVTNAAGTAAATFTCVDSAAYPNITCALTGC